MGKLSNNDPGMDIIDTSGSCKWSVLKRSWTSRSPPLLLATGQLYIPANDLRDVFPADRHMEGTVLKTGWEVSLHNEC